MLLPGEVCAERLERGNHGHIMKAVLNAQKSAEAIVPGGKKPGKGRTNTSPSRRRKEDGMTKAECAVKGDCPQRDGTEGEGYQRGCDVMGKTSISVRTSET